jgi:hypothetical protein
MEEDNEHLNSPHLELKKFKKQIEYIQKAASEAQRRMDMAAAHNPETQLAISVVESFLRKQNRLCYGGQAINAHLPSKYKFYDPNTNVPDYDFFTPNQEDDIVQLVKELRKSGFTEVSVRDGMHEGTVKVYVNFIPVADITQIDASVYELLYKNRAVFDGISYLDVNTLRMLMYLELSRPKGEVSRWEKVYERLLLLNTFADKVKCDMHKRRLADSIITDEEHQTVVDFIINQRRVFCGTDIIPYYRHSFSSGQRHHRNRWVFSKNRPLYFYSPDAKNDMEILNTMFKNQIGYKKFKVKKVEGLGGGDLIPPMYIFIRNRKHFLIIFQETACHSYMSAPISGKDTIRLASIDTLITLYLALYLLKSKFVDLASFECLAKELIHISMDARARPQNFVFPFISIQCSGKQTSLPSLIRQKIQRLQKTKKRLLKLVEVSSTKNSKKEVSNIDKAGRINKTLRRRTNG